MMIIHHLKSNQIHVSYVCVTDNKAFSCGYRYPADEKQPKTNNKLIHDIFATVQFKNTNSSQRVSIQSSGFSICLPDGWERQDLLNQIIVYAPGNNFRPRISTSDHDEQEEDWASPQQVIEEFCEVVKYMKHLYKDVKWGKIEEIMDSQHQGLMMKWEAAIKRRNGKFVDVIGIIVAVPHNSRGAIVNYQAPRESFCQFEDVFWQTIDSIQWLK